MNKSAKTAKGNSADGEAAAAAAAGSGEQDCNGQVWTGSAGALHCVWSHPRQIDDIEGVTALSPSMWDY